MKFYVIFGVIVLVLFCIFGFLMGMSSKQLNVENFQEEQKDICEGGICPPPEGY